MKYAVITGASSGIGLAAAAELVKKNYAVICVGRDEKRCAQAGDEIRSAKPGARVTFLCADLMQQREVKRIAEEIKQILALENEEKLDVLINNAGCVRSWYATTEEGYEQQFALNHLAGFLLTYHLLEHLKRAGGRVLMTGSKSHMHFRMRWNDIMLTRGYNPLTAYKQSKLSNILFARGLNDRYVHEGIRACVVDPGLVRTDIGNKNTGGLVSWIWGMRKKRGVPAEVPARTYLYLCDQNLAADQLYYYRCSPRRYSAQVTHENADRLFALSERLCGITYPEKIEA